MVTLRLKSRPQPPLLTFTVHLVGALRQDALHDERAIGINRHGLAHHQHLVAVRHVAAIHGDGTTMNVDVADGGSGPRNSRALWPCLP